MAAVLAETLLDQLVCVTAAALVTTLPSEASLSLCGFLPLLAFPEMRSMRENDDDELSEHASNILLSSFYSNMPAQASELVELMRSSSVSGLFLKNKAGTSDCASVLPWCQFMGQRNTVLY